MNKRDIKRFAAVIFVVASYATAFILHPLYPMLLTVLFAIAGVTWHLAGLYFEE
jgi:hypothetical protein